MADLENRARDSGTGDRGAPADQPALDELASRRFRVALVLTGAMMVIYFGFILLVAFGKSFLGNLVTDGLSLGILLGVLVILSTWVLTWIYVRWANRTYEPAADRLRR
jgi:uncharacterized membrane protein (DUF485 family)